MKNYLVELIGTFFLVFVIGLSVIAPGAGTNAPLAIGLTLMVMVYAGGPISGGHYNPAVTLAVYLRGKCPGSNVLGYWASQIVGAAAAAELVLITRAGSVIKSMPVVPTPAFIVEFLFTFALAYVVLNVATSRKSEGNSYFGLAIGSTVIAGALAVGPISGAAFNPAVAVGVAVMGLSVSSQLWLFFVANFLGGAAAALVYRAVNPDE